MTCSVLYILRCQRTCKDTKKKQFTTAPASGWSAVVMSKNMQRYKKKAIHNTKWLENNQRRDVKEHAKIQKKSNSQPFSLL